MMPQCLRYATILLVDQQFVQPFVPQFPPFSDVGHVAPEVTTVEV